MTGSAARRPAIAGLGITEVGKVYDRDAARFAADAVRLAVADAGLDMSDVDGLLVNSGTTGEIGVDLQSQLQLPELRLLSEIQAFGASAGAMVTQASLAVQAGMADVVVCVFADAPLREGKGSGAVYAGRAQPSGFAGMIPAAGLTSVNAVYALAARRHMETYGTTSEQLGAIAVAQRAWAAMNPLAQLREPITIADHQASRWIAEPLHLLDCCLVSNGGIAVVVTSADRAAQLRQPPVHVLGFAQSHVGHPNARDGRFGLVSGAAQAGPAALKMAGLGISDVDVAELYDCYTYTVLLTLEDYGFCAKGEGGPFAASGALGPGGSLAVNTGGGQLSSYYLWGMTPLSEAIIQARGHGGPRQAPRNDVVLVSGNGGLLAHHATLVLSPHPHS
ncbi:Acetyl-CoA acetyltransferase [Saccharopolyspora antimicrobica]|uniref:Acetyl-CoA acetyltransferase n=1 Tax=Saccharopolyspora antimicrobica TaxID=455193 RepID=A0A1I4TVU8_9PSEU|nr:thiolase family protein [Saccharopolyspora antimicrobica]RKT88576.1 acetyl-CoA acetyltransferase [Saccharopolyspora antimicrobica]SFM80842.1 Acetyl-CoA acetyltransferase [Saccharopolyspora antimicrobica]